MASAEAWRSKLNTKYLKSDIDRWDATLKAQIRTLKQKVENKRCFDCGSDDVTWASPKLGIFICVACSDVHRAAGAHITCVKNFNTYLWGPDEVALMTAVGNKRGRELYGRELVSPSADKNSKVAACTRKYGGAEVQRLVETEIANAKAAASRGAPVIEEARKPAALRQPVEYRLEEAHRAVKPQGAVTDLLEDLLHTDTFATPAKGLACKTNCPAAQSFAATLRSPKAEQRNDGGVDDLEAFLAECNQAVVKAQPCTSAPHHFTKNSFSTYTPFDEGSFVKKERSVDLFEGWESWS